MIGVTARRVEIAHAPLPRVDTLSPIRSLCALCTTTTRSACSHLEIAPPADYRQYTAEDLDRLRQILHYRELGFPLNRIAELMAEPDVDASAHLRRQHHLLRERIERLQAMVEAIEHEMEARQMGISLTPEEQFEIFGPAGLGPDQSRGRRGAASLRDCSYDIHRGLAEMYVADPRFTATYDKVAPGLAQYVHDAIVANVDRYRR